VTEISLSPKGFISLVEFLTNQRYCKFHVLPDFAIIAASPTDFKQMVLPPVFGPVITKTLVPLEIWKSAGIGGAPDNTVSAYKYNHVYINFS
jgi:hypothetical protein